MGGMSSTFSELADLWSALEESGPESTITEARPIDRDLLETEAVSLEIGVEIPFLDRPEATSAAEVTLKDAELTSDGTVRLTCIARAFSDDEVSRGEEASESDDGESAPASSGDGESNSTAPMGADANEPLEERDSHSAGTDGSDIADDAPPPSTRNDATDDSRSSLPAYRDPDRLAAVYEAHDTFAKMTEALGVDVTPQTVRRYMIEHGIHEPSSRSGPTSVDSLLEMDPDSVPALDGRADARESESGDIDSEVRDRGAEETPLVADGDGGSTRQPSDARTGGESPDSRRADGETSSGERTTDGSDTDTSANTGRSDDPHPEEADGRLDVDSAAEDAVDLPEHLTISRVKSVVTDAKTLYEAQRALELDRNETRHLLGELNLLDYIQGRLATRGLEERTVQDINQRIRSAVASPGSNRD